MITILNDCHITATEKRALELMIDSGMLSAYNKVRTKAYEIIKGTPDKNAYIYDIRIHTKSAWFIGETPKWRSKNITIKHIKNKG